MFTIENHAKVRIGTHSAVGRVTAFVIDPETLRLTHLVVRHRGLLPAAHLYHLEDLSRTSDALRVTGPAAASEPTRDNEITFVPIGGWPHPQETYDVGIVHVVGWPRTALGGGSRPRWTTDDLGMVVDFDKLPKGHVELDGTSEVYDRSRHLVGHVRSVTADETGALQRLRVRPSALWAPQAFDVPAASIKKVINGEVSLLTSRDNLSPPNRGIGDGQAAS